jgi:3-hydroxybutyryl-CoA dehydrogenase
MDERLGIAGSGAIACGLARLANEHLDTVLWARSPESVERSRAALPASVRVVSDLGELRDRTIVVEAIVEDAAIKGELLGQLGALLDPEALIATTTSSLSVAALAEASARPQHFAAMHVFNPVERMELVEVAFHGDVSDQTHQRMHALCEALGKTPVEVPDTPGFVVNRLLFPYLFDAVRLLEREDLEPDAVDDCMRLGAGHPMGPLALLDFVGLDVAVAIGESIDAEIPARVRELIEAGRLGRKSGAGFYEYQAGNREA